MRRGRLQTLVLVSGALFVIDASFWMAFRIRFGAEVPSYNLEPFINLIPAITGISLILLWLLDLISPSRKQFLQVLYRSVMLASVLTLIGMAVAFFMRGFAFPRSVLLIAAAIQPIALTLWQLLFQSIEDVFRNRSKAIIVGTRDDDAAVRILSTLAAKHFEMQGCYDWADEGVLKQAISGADTVFVLPSVSGSNREEVIIWCLDRGKDIRLVPDAYEILLSNARVNSDGDLLTIHVNGFILNSWQSYSKRIFDLILSGVGAVFLLFLLPIVALVIRMDSPGPVFYRQDRVGQHGRVFRLIKFRTMIAGAEDHTGPVLAARSDPRVTRVGRLLRATRLDELPQLINILKGEMSFVGPRPERPVFVNKYLKRLPAYGYRHNVKPGLTGLAQIQGSYGTLAEDKLRFDLMYISGYSLLLDFQILFQTIRVIKSHLTCPVGSGREIAGNPGISRDWGDFAE